jgi:primosomal protein N' (replication factor Y)
MKPDEPAIQVALTHDATAFAEAELKNRQGLRFPPFARLVALKLAGNVEQRVQAAAERLAKLAGQLIARGEPADIIGPASAPLARLRGKHRWMLLLRSADHAPLHRLARALDEAHRAHGPRGVELAVDVDPVSLL